MESVRAPQDDRIASRKRIRLGALDLLVAFDGGPNGPAHFAEANVAGLFHGRDVHFGDCRLRRVGCVWCCGGCHMQTPEGVSSEFRGLISAVD